MSLCRIFFVRAFLVLSLFSSLTVSASAITLSDAATGLSVNAPKGYKLKSSGGVYTLSKSGVYVRFMTARSPFDLKGTADSFVKLSKMTSVTRKNKSNEVKLIGKLKGKNVTVVLRPNGSFVDIFLFGGQAARKRVPVWREINGVPVAAVTLNEIAALQRILNTRQGGITVPLQVNIPTRVFTAADGTTAVVPNLPGWTVTGGGGGIISGGNAAQGVFELGVPALVSYPGFSGVIINGPVDAVQAIVQVWPKYNKTYTGAQVQVTTVEVIPGTENFMAPNWPSSGLFAISFLLNGQPWVGLMSSGVTAAPGLEYSSFLWYHSYIAIPANGPGGIGAALTNTWATWNHSEADAKRLADAVKTIASIRGGGGPIDPQVFEEKANAWDQYIRGPF